MVSQNLLPTSSYTPCIIQCVPEHGMNHRFFQWTASLSARNTNAIPTLQFKLLYLMEVP